MDPLTQTFPHKTVKIFYYQYYVRFTDTFILRFFIFISAALNVYSIQEV